MVGGRLVQDHQVNGHNALKGLRQIRHSPFNTSCVYLPTPMLTGIYLSLFVMDGRHVFIYINHIGHNTDSNKGKSPECDFLHDASAFDG